MILLFFVCCFEFFPCYFDHVALEDYLIYIVSDLMCRTWNELLLFTIVSEYYRTFQDMHRAVSLYYRTVRFKLDLLKFTSRKYEMLCKDF